MLLGEAFQARAILAVDRDALAARHEAANRIRRRRLAAFGELGRKAAHADHQHATPCRRAAFFLLISGGCDRRGSPPRLQRDLQLPQVDLVARHRREQLVGLGEAELRAPASRGLTCVAPSRRSSFSTTARPCAHGLGERLGVEPLAHLGRARALCTKPSSGFSQSREGPPCLCGDDLDALAVRERRVERHHLAVDLGAAAAVAEVGVHRVGEVDRRRAGAAGRSPCPAA